MGQDHGARTRIDRRKLLKISGGSLIGISSFPAISTAKNNKYKLKEFRENEARLYGDHEAKIITHIVRKYLKRQEKRGFSDEIGYEKTTNEILEHPNTPRASQDIRQFQKNRRKLKDTLVEDDSNSSKNNNITTEAIGTAATGIRIKYATRRKRATSNASAAVETRPSINRVRSKSNASVYGNAYAWGRLYGRFRPKRGGTHYVTSRYFRRGSINATGSASAKVLLYVRADGAGTRRTPVETITTNRNSTTTRTKGFDLRKGVGYNVGIELFTKARSFGKGGSLADFYSRLPVRDTVRRLHVKSLKIT